MGKKQKAKKKKAEKRARKARESVAKPKVSDGKKSARGKVKAKKKSAARAAKRALRSKRKASTGPSPKEPVARQRTESKVFTSALKAYELGIKHMHANNFEKAIAALEAMIQDYPTEREIHDRARLLIHACEQRIKEKKRLSVRSADEHYDLGVADLNRRELDSALSHLEQALKLSPKAEHILYALAAVSARRGDRDQALHYLKQSIHHRPENRFLAANDGDFASLAADADFRGLVTPSQD